MPSCDVMRVIDASLNRAAEGLRVVEDFARLVIDDAHLTQQAKQLRHDLADVAATLPTGGLLAARDTLGDVGTRLSTEAEALRQEPRDVCAASLKRVEQSLRSLEEYGKLVDVHAASRWEALRYRVYTLEKAIGIGSDARERLAAVKLMVLIGGGESDDQFEQIVTPLIYAGAGAIQLRDKNLEGWQLDDRQLLSRARLLRELTRDTNTLAVINDRADVAALVGADAVHLGRGDLPVADARRIVGPRMLIGVSTHNVQQVRKSILDGACYLGAGPTFPSRTKKFAELAGLEFLRQVAAETSLPVFAIGGIAPANLEQVLETGITRMAVGAAITQAEDPAAVCRELLHALAGATVSGQA